MVDYSDDEFENGGFFDEEDIDPNYESFLAQLQQAQTVSALRSLRTNPQWDNFSGFAQSNIEQAYQQNFRKIVVSTLAKTHKDKHLSQSAFDAHLNTLEFSRDEKALFATVAQVLGEIDGINWKSQEQPKKSTAALDNFKTENESTVYAFLTQQKALSFKTFLQAQIATSVNEQGVIPHDFTDVMKQCPQDMLTHVNVFLSPIKSIAKAEDVKALTQIVKNKNRVAASFPQDEKVLFSSCHQLKFALLRCRELKKNIDAGQPVFASNEAFEEKIYGKNHAAALSNLKTWWQRLKPLKQQSQSRPKNSLEVKAPKKLEQTLHSLAQSLSNIHAMNTVSHLWLTLEKANEATVKLTYPEEAKARIEPIIALHQRLTSPALTLDAYISLKDEIDKEYKGKPLFAETYGLLCHYADKSLRTILQRDIAPKIARGETIDFQAYLDRLKQASQEAVTTPLFAQFKQHILHRKMKFVAIGLTAALSTGAFTALTFTTPFVSAGLSALQIGATLLAGQLGLLGIGLIVISAATYGLYKLFASRLKAKAKKVDAQTPLATIAWTILPAPKPTVSAAASLTPCSFNKNTTGSLREAKEAKKTVSRENLVVALEADKAGLPGQEVKRVQKPAVQRKPLLVRPNGVNSSLPKPNHHSKAEAKNQLEDKKDGGMRARTQPVNALMSRY